MIHASTGTTMSTVILTCDLHELKTSALRTNLGISASFCSRVKSSYGTERQTDRHGRTDGRTGDSRIQRRSQEFDLGGYKC